MTANRSLDEQGGGTPVGKKTRTNGMESRRKSNGIEESRRRRIRGKNGRGTRPQLWSVPPELNAIETTHTNVEIAIRQRADAQLLPLRRRFLFSSSSFDSKPDYQSRLLLKRLRECGDRLRRRHRRLSPPRPHFGIGFQSHSTSVLFLRQLKQRNGWVTIGEDEQITPQQSAMCLKVFDLDRMQSDGMSSSVTSPDCVGILRIFTNQFPEAKPIG
ncbi:uncharacterized protein [Pyrus communis]|uniref:uncharacterized protein n=1 Tax=Pyrus communis TaxID=23211 RepID=UPI0035C19A3C